MTAYRYEMVDVFTDVPFTGNQLAVFADARGLPEARMQAVAREIGFSETTFVLPPDDRAHDCRVRIFTPARELPFAGHPTIGTAYVRYVLGKTAASARAVLEEGIGPVAVTCGPDGAEMEQPIPAFGATRDDFGPIAAALGVKAADLALDRSPAQLVSSGVPFLFVPVRDRAACARMRPRPDLLEKLLGEDAHGIVVWTADVEREGSTVHARMFGAGLGISEDPATGSANGPLAAYLLRHRIVPDAPVVRIVTEQGFEMGRPSILRATVERSGGDTTAVRVGGSCVLVGHGVLEI